LFQLGSALSRRLPASGGSCPAFVVSVPFPYAAKTSFSPEIPEPFSTDGNHFGPAYGSVTLKNQNITAKSAVWARPVTSEASHKPSPTRFPETLFC